MASSDASGVRYEWYQTDAFVVVTVLLGKLGPVEFKVTIGEQMVSIVAERSDEKIVDLSLELSQSVVPAQSSYKPFPSKLEIKMKKSLGLRWSTLERLPQHGPVLPDPHQIQIDSSQPATLDYPSSSAQKKDWDKIVTDISKLEEEEEKNLSGEAAINNLFQKIYADGSEEVRRAMNKSFMESGGTVLSTNWNEVGKETVDVKPPEGMEYKKWEQ